MTLLRETLKEEREAGVPELPALAPPAGTLPQTARKSIDDATVGEWDAAAAATRPRAGLVRVELPPRVQRTPEVDAWVKHVEQQLDAQLRDQLFNLLVYGAVKP